jgi:hypothetical protein
VAIVDSADDALRRYVVRLSTYDPTRRERTDIEIGAFDDPGEGTRCAADAAAELRSRQATGTADPRDRVTMVVKQPGDDEHNRQRRIQERRRRRS